MPIEVVIFDLDGTLIAFNLDYKALRGEVRENLLRAGVPASILNVNESVFEMLQKAEVYFRNNGKTEQAFNKIHSSCLAIAEKYEMEAAKTTNLQSGTLETLKGFKKMKLKIGLCTTSSESASNYVLQRFKIAEFFEVVISRDNVKHVKPDTEQFELALKTLGAKPKNAVIIGDSIADMQSAKELKTIAIGIPTGISTEQQLVDNGANYIVTSLIDLLVLIKKIIKV